MAITGSALLAPQMSPNGYTEANFANTFKVNGDVAHLSNWESGVPSIDGLPIGFVTLDGNRIIEESYHLATFPAKPRIWDGDTIQMPDEPFTRRFDIEVPIDDDKLHRVRRIAFGSPFCREGEPSGFVVTNTVKLRRKQ
jgi:hypothetical protein